MHLSVLLLVRLLYQNLSLRMERQLWHNCYTTDLIDKIRDVLRTYGIDLDLVLYNLMMRYALNISSAFDFKRIHNLITTTL